jgi:ACS family tartrate transporter-like MFS transporter
MVILGTSRCVHVSVSPSVSRTGINATANISRGAMISVVRLVKGATGSYTIALLPLVALTSTAAVSLMLISRTQQAKAAAVATAGA